MKLSPVETSTVLLGLRLVELCRTEYVCAVTDCCNLLERQEFRDYDPTLATADIPRLRDKINLVDLDASV
jgi:hypothetical protein